MDDHLRDLEKEAREALERAKALSNAARQDTLRAQRELTELLMEEEAAALARMNRLLKGGVSRAASPSTPTLSPLARAARGVLPNMDPEQTLVLQRDIPELGARVGDLLALCGLYDVGTTLSGVRGSVRHLSSRELDILRCLAGVNAWVPICESEWLVSRYINDRRRRARTGPRLYLVKPLAAPTVSEPIVANFDEAALFELLSQIGCRMPSRERTSSQ